MNVHVLDARKWILADGVNSFAGTLVDGNLIEFTSVPFNPPGAGHPALRAENIFIESERRP
jgi:hypothetical protein